LTKYGSEIKRKNKKITFKTKAKENEKGDYNMKRMKRVNLIMGLMGLLLFLSASLASAQVVAKSDEWKSFFGIYAWIPAIYGDVRVKGVNYDIDAIWTDTVADTTFVGSIHYEGFKGPWGIMLEAMYYSMEFEDYKGNVNLPGNYKLNFTHTYFEAAVPYRLTWNPVVADVFVGLRYNYIDRELGVWQYDIDNHGSLTFTDLIFGGRVLFPLSKQWSIGLRADIGGFGIGNATDLSAQGVASVNWQINDLFSLHAGYKALYMRYDNNNDKWDTTEHGPFFAVGFSF